jgi:hypothetical protein
MIRFPAGGFSSPRSGVPLVLAYVPDGPPHENEPTGEPEE